MAKTLTGTDSKKDKHLKTKAAILECKTKIESVSNDLIVCL